ncbi:MAG: alpha-amylase family glycosyl hydrolase [Bacteroidota bacterium]
MILAVLMVFLLGIIMIACKRGPEKRKAIVESHVVHPEWSKNAIIYEVNVRQYTNEGTFKAFEEHLPRLKEMEVDILWLMPIHPIGQENRKGELGSYYSVRDYKAVNPEFGTLEDMKRLVDMAHELGMYVILDWVANHTAWDHAWMNDHPEWYEKDRNGEIFSPFDWTDVAKLDFKSQDMRAEMLDALKYWVVEADVDGYRCDVANEVPVDFWNTARAELDNIKPVFMLAEAEQPNHHVHAFDMSYAWELHHIMNEIARGEKNAGDIDKYFEKHDTLYPVEAYRMCFITNHDENSWNGTEYERMGAAANTFAVLTYTLPGMPMIYTGQEAALNKRLKFFAKDTIEWGAMELSGFYQKLGKLRKENPALWSGVAGGSCKKMKTSDNENIYAFMRKCEANTVIVIANLSSDAREFAFKKSGKSKVMTDWFGGSTFTLEPGMQMSMSPWEYRVLILNRE